MSSTARTIAFVVLGVLFVVSCSGNSERVALGAHVDGPGFDDQLAASGMDLGLLEQGSLEGRDVVVWFWAEW